MIFKSNISPEQNDEKSFFLHVDTNSLQKENLIVKYCAWACSEMDVPNLDTVIKSWLYHAKNSME